MKTLKSKDKEYITCVGSANLDYTLKLEEDLILETSNPVVSSVSLGGVVRNIAENLSKLDHYVSLMSIVGNDNAGEELIKRLKDQMSIFAVDKISNYNTGAYYSIIGKDGNMNVGFADMDINKNMTGKWILRHKDDLSMGSWIIADTNITKDAIESLITYSLTENKKLAIIGVSGPKMKNVPKDLKGVEILICNLDESQAFFQTKENNLKELIKLWLNTGVKNIIITNGKDGSMFSDGKEIKHQPAIIIKDELVVDVTGAGDSFSGAVLHGLISNKSLASSVLYGTISASKTIQSKYAVNPELSVSLIKKELKKYENL